MAADAGYTPAARESFAIALPDARDADSLIPGGSTKAANHSMKSPAFEICSGPIFGNGGRPRGVSMSSSEPPDAAVDAIEISQHEPRPNPKKRPSTDTLDYPRRRATIACEVCRSRKSRCDGQRPKCRLCSELNAECIYREPGVKLDAGDKLILEHLNRIEGLLQANIVTQSQNLHSLQSLHLISGSPSGSNGTTSGFSDDMLARSQAQMPQGSAVGLPPVMGLNTWGQPANISTMPRMHTTPALHLLQWPLIRELVSRPYDPQNLLQLEMAREPLRFSNSLKLDLSNAASLVQAFFERVNVWYACVNPHTWPTHYRAALGQGFQDGPDSCIVLLVLALGSAAAAGSISYQPPDKDPPGYTFFAAAWGLLPTLMTRNTVICAQCTALASAYLFYLVRPLEAWTLLSNTSTKLQLLLGSPGRIPPHSKELSERVFWNTLLFESDLLAELDLPHSGIVRFEETMELPRGFEEEDSEDPEDPAIASSRDELWYFLAGIALRRLLNRVSHLVHQKGTPMSLATLDPVTAELDFQLAQWYESLPLPVQFPHTRSPLANPLQTVLRLRYHACRTIIFRPYVLAVLENETLAHDATVRENCRKCLDASIRQLEHITAHHAGHLPYLWQGALSMVSQTLLVMGATMSAPLALLLPPPGQMDVIISDVVIEVERYAHLAPSLRLSAEIVREAEDRRQRLRSIAAAVQGIGS